MFHQNVPAPQWLNRPLYPEILITLENSFMNDAHFNRNHKVRNNNIQFFKMLTNFTWLLSLFILNVRDYTRDKQQKQQMRKKKIIKNLIQIWISLEPGNICIVLSHFQSMFVPIIIIDAWSSCIFFVSFSFPWEHLFSSFSKHLTEFTANLIVSLIARTKLYAVVIRK